jgi:cold shock CspA family protein
MPTLLIAAASALLLAALVTETTQRFWPGSYLALLVITFIALFLNGLFNAKLKQSKSAPAPANTNRNQQDRKSGDRDTSQKRGQNRAQGRSSERDSSRNSERTKNKPKRDDDRNSNRRDSRAEKPQEDKRSRQDAPPKEASKERSQQAPESQVETAPRGPQETGTVKWFNRSKGYGFIIRDNDEEVFVHQRSIVSEGDDRQRPVLRDGQKVSFEVAHLEKGAQAEVVKGLD